jgi:hypothetical protein
MTAMSVFTNQTMHACLWFFACYPLVLHLHLCCKTANQCYWLLAHRARVVLPLVVAAAVAARALNLVWTPIWTQSWLWRCRWVLQHLEAQKLMLCVRR